MSYIKCLILFTILFTFLLVSCSDKDPVKSTQAAECSVINSITITTTPQLTFSWEPDCALMGCLIEPSGSGNDLWFVLSEGSNSILSPITYGVVPTGAIETISPETLISGNSYRLILFKWTGPGGDDGIILDTISFTM